jgi:hypothetical protein
MVAGGRDSKDERAFLAVVQGEKYATNPGQTQQQKEEPTGWRSPRWKERLERDESSEALEAVWAITVSRYEKACGPFQ